MLPSCRNQAIYLKSIDWFQYEGNTGIEWVKGKRKMYNRCCRGNILLTAVMQGLHFKKILKKLSESIDKSVY